MKRQTEKLKSIVVIFVTMLCMTSVSGQKPVITWVDIPSGAFTMGSPTNQVDSYSNETQHQVTLNAFKVSKYEITIAQFKAFVDATGYVTDSDKGTGEVDGGKIWTGEEWKYKAGANWKCDVQGNRRLAAEYNHPVIFVSWNDAKAFANWMGCRLPTEAEWEYACRAGTETPFNTGNNIATSQANYDGRYPYNKNVKGEFRGKTIPVGSFAPNAWGLYDMHGNVYEWCSDWYGDYPTAAQTNPKGPSSGEDRLLRGGSWMAAGEYCRSTYRIAVSPDERSSYIGFRLVSNK